MAATYSVGPIQRRQVDRAYRLIEAAGYELDLAGWRELCAATFARTSLSPPCQRITTVENARGYIAGLCVAHTSHDDLYGRLLDVPVFVVTSAGDTPGASAALLGYLTKTARNRQCGFMRVFGPDPANWPNPLDEQWKHRGTLIPVR